MEELLRCFVIVGGGRLLRVVSDEHATLTGSLDTIEGNVCKAQSNARRGGDVGEECVEDAIAVEQLDFDLELLFFGLLLFVLFLVGR